MGTGFAKKKKEAKSMQESFLKMQQEMNELEVVGTSSHGLVSVTLKGDGELKNISIKKECVDPEDVEGLQDLIKMAFQDGKAKLEAASAQKSPFQGKNPLPFNLPGF